MSQTSDTTPGHGQNSFSARWASIAIRENLAEIQKGIRSLAPLPDNVSRHKLVPIKDTPYQPSADAGVPLKVGIVGAGCAGLFTALIFDHLKEKCGLDVDYEILESNPEERLGGRLYSYRFENVKEKGDHDYYDVGAMRFPEIDIMKRTFDLFDVCGMKKHENKKPTEGDKPKKDDLIRYYLKGINTPLLYNDVQFVPPKDGDGPTGKTFGITDLPNNYLDKTPESLVSDQIKHFTEKLLENPEERWKELMNVGDEYSVRQWFKSKKNRFDYNTIEWLETFSYGNRWYDQALSELVLEDLNFSHNKDWWCVEGGSQEVAYRMRNKIEEKKKRIFFQKTVTAVSWIDEKRPGKGVDVTIKGEKSVRRYDAVFNSAPLGAVQRMNLSGLNLNWGTKQSIRSLGYGASCKVGIRFKNLWWIDMGINEGGVAKTDLPLRVCVYPSYNIRDKYDKDGKLIKADVPGVLLCSYTWSQEAQRIASLINRKSPQDEEELKTLLIHNLAKLHSKTNDQEGYNKIHQIISDAYETHHAYDWYADPGTTGAFAYFGPGQFRNLYPWITGCNGKHIIIGEAASAHHAWVVGALDSAVRGVYQFLVQHAKTNKAANEALQMYNDGKVKSPYGPLPAEYDRQKDVECVCTEPEATVDTSEGAHLAFEGEWARQQVIFESIRLEQRVDHLVPDQLVPEKVTPAQVASLIEVAAPA